ncbi:uncharacterized protein C2845_PM01G44160 [Panicum miliaceum]|uniref:Replication factor A C-terminal domain-containing protein n=1 Tax=Panicum miliaceum TaxID=4540 RepID=A0A3L6TPC5_PANMI|nr:uncharacterized protein C2845_PM01G44160 [Panicum miliaceum]
MIAHCRMLTSSLPMNRSLPGPYMLEFTCHTRINAARDSGAFPDYVYNLTPFEELHAYVGDKKKFHGRNYLSGHAAFHWYFNPAIPEASALVQSLRQGTFAIRRVGEPLGDIVQPVPKPLADLLTLKEMQDIDPYEFPEKGCTCTVTIVRLADDHSWWFPSCNLCNKSCKSDGSSYACYDCGTTDKYTYKYKLCFIASDGTDEAEMVCFGEIGRRIVGKSVEAIMRAPRGRDAVPLDIAGIVSSKFTFAVSMTEKSFRTPKKSYQDDETSLSLDPEVSAATRNDPQSNENVCTTDKR